MDIVTMLGHMPPEYVQWVNKFYKAMVKYARAKRGDADAVNDAILRTSQSKKFPANDMSLWWSWHRGAIKSYLSHQARGGQRAADLAQEVAGAIISERGHRRGTSDTDFALAVFNQEEKPEGEVPRLTLGQLCGWYHVAEIARCKKCGLPVRWELEREPFEDALDHDPVVIPVAACYGCGRREYNRPRDAAITGPLFGLSEVE